MDGTNLIVRKFLEDGEARWKMGMMIHAFRDYFKQLSCKHEWEYVGKVTYTRGFYSKVCYCRKCGKFKEEAVVE